VRKYAEGGPDDRLQLRAHNLTLFLELAAGVDETTWLFHPRRSDYSAWFREVIHDDALADDTQAIEADARLSAKDRLGAITRLLQLRYTQPENPVLPNLLTPEAEHRDG
jgi:hypothetical protein